jgi:hypothetical protein
MIEVKLKSSKLYEGAYFVMRPSAESGALGEREMLDEAKRIIGAIDEDRMKSKRNSLQNKLLSGALLLLLGLVIGFAIGVLI